MKDYYAILGVPRTATADEIKQAYRRLAWQYHPDRNAGNKAAEDTFKQLTEAYLILSNEYKRSDYDFKYEKTHQNVNTQQNNKQPPPKEPERKATAQSYTTGQTRSQGAPKKPLYTINIDPKNVRSVYTDEDKRSYNRKFLNTFCIAAVIVGGVFILALIANFKSFISSDDSYVQPSDGDLTNTFMGDSVKKEAAPAMRYFYTDATKTKKARATSEEGLQKLKEKHPNAIETDEQGNIIGKVSKSVFDGARPKKPFSVNPVNIPILTPEQKLQLDRNQWVAEGWTETKVNTGHMPACYNFTPKRGDIDNYLEVRVGGGTDVVIKVMSLQTNKCIRYVFINSHSTYRIKNIPEGKYYLKIAYGKDWFSKVENGRCIGKFLRNKIYEKGDEILDFIVQEDDEGVRFSVFQLWLDVEEANVMNNFDSHNISEDEFNV
jgi:curved DNA-binding protein CbpA